MVEDNARADEEHYSGIARLFHWVSAVVVLGLIVSGLLMVWRGKDLNIWDNLTNTLYSSHKTFGLLFLILIIARLGYRLMHGAPRDEPTLEPFQRVVSHLTHWGIYGLLLALPVLGWVGISMFPALNILGGLNAPAITGPDRAMSQQVFWIHGTAAYLLIVLVAMHVGAALYHHFIRGDGVLRRMMPGLKRRD